MDTIANIKTSSSSRHSLPYPKGVRVLVVDKKLSEDSNRLDVGLADATGSIKMLCFERKFFDKFVPNKAVILRNFIKGYSRCIIFKKTSLVAPAHSFDVPDEIKNQARSLIQLVAANTYSIPTIKQMAETSTTTSGERKLVSVEGTITMVSLRITIFLSLKSIY